MELVAPSPLNEGLITWRAQEGARRLALYAILAALAYPLIVAGSLGVRILAAALCVALAGVVLVVPRLRPYVHAWQAVNVGALVVLAVAYYVAAHASALSLGVVMLAIVASQYAFVRRRELAVAYIAGTVYLIAAQAVRGAFATPSDVAATAMIVAAFFAAYVIGSRQIVTQNTLVNERLRKAELAHIDPLTGLNSRAALFERLDSALASARRRRHDVALLYVDLDGFKAINDTRGHRAGDHVLVQLGCRLKRVVRTDEIAARIGGDEFVVLLPHVERFNEPEEAAQRIARIMEDPFVYEGQELKLGASIGIARSPYDGMERDKLLASADAAMYARKKGLLREA